MEDVLIDGGTWGKSRGLPAPYALIWHLLDTAAVAGALWDGYLSANQRRVIAAGLGCDEAMARALVMFWAGLHDIGKVTPGFQSQDPSTRGELRHETAGQLTIPELLAGLGDPGSASRRGKQIARWVAEIVGGHHGRYHEVGKEHPDTRFLGADTFAEQRAVLVRVVHAAVGEPALPERLDPHVAVLITGMVILADWLASQESYLLRQLKVVPSDLTIPSILAHFGGLAGPAKALMAEAGLGLPRYRDAAFEDLFPHEPNALQRSVIEEFVPALRGPGLLVVTAATGDGKTETALVAARALADMCGASGFFFALPTMATSDQMYSRVRTFAANAVDGSAAMTLLHSMSWLNDEYTGRVEAGMSAGPDVVTEEEGGGCLGDIVAPQWLRGAKRGLLAALAVGTIDQSLIAALTTKHNALRMLGLSGKVFVVDEAHSYDPYMMSLLKRLLTWLGKYGCPVVLLSATLPSTSAGQLMAAYARGAGVSADGIDVPYPGWTFVPAQSEASPVTISGAARAAVIEGRRIGLRVETRMVRHVRDGPEAGTQDRRQVVKSALDPVRRSGGCAAVVCNTVDDAQRTYALIRDWAGTDVKVVLLHARFPALQREQITQAVTDALGRTGERPRAMIVVATQVIEQSLDLDVDLLVTDLAPMALLLQRAGRCWRHERVRPSWAWSPHMVVLVPGSAKGEYEKPRHWGDVYAAYLLRATWRRLSGIEMIQVPQDVQQHMEAVYVEEPDGDDPQLRADLLELRASEMAQRDVAGLGTIPEPEKVRGLFELSGNEGVPEWKATTRLGADSVRLICWYVDADGNCWLDPAKQRPLPKQNDGPNARLTDAEIRAVLQETIPVREDLLDGCPRAELPQAWQRNGWLKDLRPLAFTLVDDEVQPVAWDRRQVVLDGELGLVVTRMDGR